MQVFYGKILKDQSKQIAITYNWTEHHDDNLRKTLADTIITINHSHSYHVEAQMYEDDEIELFS